jgi:hypothetical protein
LSEEIQVETTQPQPTPAAAPTVPAPKQEAAPKHTPHTPASVDKMAQRRNELKKQKRKAHRHKINASNTPG